MAGVQPVSERELVGFYITRYAEAATPEEAESICLSRLRDEPRLASPHGYEPTGKARVYFEEIESVEATSVPDVEPGFTWYAMTADGK